MSTNVGEGQRSAAAQEKLEHHESSDDEKPLSKRPRLLPKSQSNSLNHSCHPGVNRRIESPRYIKPENPDSDSDRSLAKRRARDSLALSQEKISSRPPRQELSPKTEDGGQNGEADDGLQERQGRDWWEDPDSHDGTTKWTTLEHNGVLFPPRYEPLPAHVKMKYDGVPISLAAEAEEVARFFGEMLNVTQYTENPTFQRNFFHDFKSVIESSSGATASDGRPVDIRVFAKCDFSALFEYYQAQKACKRATSPEEKRAQKAAREAIEAPYRYCVWDGKQQKVGNFRIEPPGLFRGRGDHPKNGRVKTRVHPEHVTLNIGKDAKVPIAPSGHRWGEIRHDQGTAWLAMWKENVNGNRKYVMPAASSDIKGQSDYRKFETARSLKKHIERIRYDCQQGLRGELMATRQLATAVYLIDRLALRAGNEKGEGEAETVGCCSLKYENVTLKPPNKVIFDFLGKDSIRFYNEVEVDRQVVKNLKIFKKPPKGEGDEIFDRITTSSLNKHLSSYMPGLTAKVFRTYNASHTFSTLLGRMQPQGSVAERVKAYNEANRTVAILCNHKRTVAEKHSAQMAKLQDQVKALQYQQWRVKQQISNLDPSIHDKPPSDYFEKPESLDPDWVQQHQSLLVEDKRQKILKKYAEADIVPPEKLEAICQMEEDFELENSTGTVRCNGTAGGVDKLWNRLAKIEQRLEAMTFQVEDKENNKEVALGTSKMNYIDPRLTVVFSKRFDVPINRLFSKSLQEKFDWAMKSVDETWEF